MEKCVLQFRCAKYGEPFSVCFQRASSQHKFQIISIWITESQRGQTDLEHKHSEPSYEQTDNSFESLNFDFTGWYCPHCGHKRKDNISEFVQCGSCRELVCGGRIQPKDGAFFFACHDGCGATGKLEGEIKSYQGIKTDIVNKKLTPRISSVAIEHNPDVQALPSGEKHHHLIKDFKKLQ
jgi:hypothetical protein